MLPPSPSPSWTFSAIWTRSPSAPTTLVQLGGGQTGADRRIGRHRVGGGGVGVDAVIQIPERAQLGLKEDGFARFLGVPQECGGVCDVRLNCFTVLVHSGLPTAKLDEVVGVVKAYSSCVGEGPFVCEWFGEDAQKLRDAGAEYGAKTGRPRRVGPIDLVATRYGVEIQGATTIALTKLDILSYMDKIPVCAHYELDGQQTDEFPFPVCLQDAKPVIEYVDGWKCDISKVRSWDELPENARNYVEYVERAIGCHIGYVSVGAERDSLIIR